MPTIISFQVSGICPARDSHGTVAPVAAVFNRRQEKKINRGRGTDEEKANYKELQRGIKAFGTDFL